MGLQKTDCMVQGEVLVKPCTKCGTQLPRTTDHFYRGGTARDGLMSECKLCRMAARKLYYHRTDDFARRSKRGPVLWPRRQSRVERVRSEAFWSTRRTKQILSEIVIGFIRKRANDLAAQMAPADDLEAIGRTAAWLSIRKFKPKDGWTITGHMCRYAGWEMLRARRELMGKPMQQLESIVDYADRFGAECMGLVRLVEEANLRSVFDNMECDEVDLLWLYVGFQIGMKAIARMFRLTVEEAAKKCQMALARAIKIAKWLGLSVQSKRPLITSRFDRDLWSQVHKAGYMKRSSWPMAAGMYV